MVRVQAACPCRKGPPWLRQEAADAWLRDQDVIEARRCSRHGKAENGSYYALRRREINYPDASHSQQTGLRLLSCMLLGGLYVLARLLTTGKLGFADC